MKSRIRFRYPIGPGMELDGFITYPETPAEKLPALALAFGGNWTVGSPEQFFPQAEVFAQAGYAVVTPDYRVFSRHGTSPRESVSDFCHLWCYLRDNVELLGLDRDRMALGGGSAGGHIAIMAGIITGIFPKAYILYNPIVRTSGDRFWNRQLPKGQESFPPPPAGLNYDSFSDIDPMHRLGDRFAPVLLMHGSEDREVPVEDARRFAEKIRAVGEQVRLKIYDGVGHGFFNAANGAYYFNETNREVLAFLKEYLQE